MSLFDFCFVPYDASILSFDIGRPVIRGRPSAKRAIHVCGRPRWVFVMIFSAGNQVP